MKNLAAAMLSVQGKLKPVQPNADNTYHHSKYADLPAVVEAAAPILTEAGLVILQRLDAESDGGPVLITTLYHVESGEQIESRIKLAVAKATAQELGSWITYARRYSIAAMCGISVRGEDDDGNAASVNQRGGRDKQPAAPLPPPEPPTLEQKAAKVLAGLPVATEKQLADCKTWYIKNSEKLPQATQDDIFAALQAAQRRLAATVT